MEEQAWVLYLGNVGVTLWAKFWENIWEKLLVDLGEIWDIVDIKYGDTEMTKIVAAKREIRKLFSNEIECLYEGDFPVRAGVIFTREIVLEGQHQRKGFVITSSVSYIIYKSDGYWEQIASHTVSDWQDINVNYNVEI